MKRFIKYLMLVLIIPIAFVVSGCSFNDKAISIKSIDKTDSVGVVDTYTITYTDGSTSDFTIVNGQDGANLYNNITINDLYNQVKDSKPSGYSLIDFINEYLDIQVDTTAIASAKALRSAVSIFVEHEVDIVDYNNILSYTNNPVYGPQPNYGVKQSITWGAGAGVIYSLDKEAGEAYIITNYHVCFSTGVKADDGIATRFTTYIYGSESIDLNDLMYLQYYNNNCKDFGYLFDEFDEDGKPVVDYGFGAIEAEYIGGSEQYDIAVLKVTDSDIIKNSDCLSAEVHNSDEVSAGSSAIAVGNPDAYGISVTDGVISVDSEYISVKISDTAVQLREFRIDTPVNSGNSGGGLFDGFGRLIGIVNAKTSDTSTENVSYAIPSNVAIGVAQSIIDNCDGVDRKTKRILLGVTIQIVNSQAEYDKQTGLMHIKETVKVAKVENDSLAFDMGLKSGDVLTNVAVIKPDKTLSVEINRMFSMIDLMLTVREGDCVKIDYIRDGVAGSATSTPVEVKNFIEIN